MGIESRQGPIYFHPVESEKFRSEYDRIFRSRDKNPETTPESNISAEEPKQNANKANSKNQNNNTT